MSGLQAGFTGGSINDNTLPSGFFLGTSGVDTRGFIDPESASGWKCEGDWGVVSAWLGCTVTPNRTQKEALECANNGITIGPSEAEFEIIESVEIRVDNVTIDTVATLAKLGSLPAQFNFREAGIKSWGAFLEPYSLATGIHTAEVIFHFTPDACSFFGLPIGCGAPIGPVNFEVITD